MCVCALELCDNNDSKYHSHEDIHTICIINNNYEHYQYNYNCDWICENRPLGHILYFEKYQFEMLKPLWFSCATM